MERNRQLEPAAALATMDALAARVIALAAPIRFDVVRSAAELGAVYRLRYEVVVGRGWVRPEDFPDQQERDHFDDDATHIVGWDGERLAVVARAVFPAPGRPLPTEAGFALKIEPAGQVVDWSRHIVARAYTDRQHRLFAGLLGRSWLEVRARGYARVCGNVTPAMIRVYRRVGIRLTILGPARPYWGEERYPVLFDVEGSVPSLLARFGDPAQPPDGGG